MYVTKDPKEQPIWSTDVARLNYIIRKILKKKEFWFNDTRGEKLKHLLIEPLLTEIGDVVNTYLRHAYIPDTCDWEIEYARQIMASEFVKKLKDEKSYADKINQYIAPHFKATKEKLLIK